MIHHVYSIAEEIKRLREERDMTQEELAESAEISLSHLSKVELSLIHILIMLIQFMAFLWEQVLHLNLHSKVI